MRAALESAFAAAFWFADTALNQNEYLQPQKLQRLLFLAQAYYAAAHPGRTLMPAVFVADGLGPMEPNIFLAFSQGRPDIALDAPLPEDAEAVLLRVWRRFGHLSCDHLTRLTRDMPAYRQALQRGERTEIGIDAMRLSISHINALGGGDPLGRPKFLRTQNGRHVRVRVWTPGEPGITDGDVADASPAGS